MQWIKRFIDKYILVILFILLWEISTELKVVDVAFLPPFSKIILTIFEMIWTGRFVNNFCISMFRAFSGFFVAVIIGIPLGFLLGGWFKKIKLALDVLLEVCSQINPFLMFHILILFLGIGEFSKITIIAWTCLWPIIFSTIAGINNVNEELLKVGTSFGLNKVQLFLKVIVPSTIPEIFVGLRLSLGYALIMLTAAEMMGSKSGLGYLIINSEENYRIKDMYAAVLIIAFVALVVDAIMTQIEKKLSRFKELEEELV